VLVGVEAYPDIPPKPVLQSRSELRRHDAFRHRPALDGYDLTGGHSKLNVRNDAHFWLERAPALAAPICVSPKAITTDSATPARLVAGVSLVLAGSIGCEDCVPLMRPEFPPPRPGQVGTAGQRVLQSRLLPGGGTLNLCGGSRYIYDYDSYTASDEAEDNHRSEPVSPTGAKVSEVRAFTAK
jgi:hypothetical protein